MEKKRERKREREGEFFRSYPKITKGSILLGGFEPRFFLSPLFSFAAFFFFLRWSHSVDLISLSP
jgi:hypothetical protein